MGGMRTKWLGLGVVGAVVLGLGVLGYVARRPQNLAFAQAPTEEQASAEEGPISVKTINPHRSPNFKMEVKQPAYVAPYFQIDLRSRVPGPVEYLIKSIG